MVSPHLAADLILACAVTSANRPEEEATPQLNADMSRLGAEAPGDGSRAGQVDAVRIATRYHEGFFGRREFALRMHLGGLVPR